MLQPSDFQPPYGPLRSSLVPGDDLDVFLTAWIAEAEEKAEVAGLGVESPEARAFVLWRAYDLRCQSEIERGGGEIKSIAPDDEGRIEYTTSKTEAPNYCALAARYAREADALITPLPADPLAGWPVVRSLR